MSVARRVALVAGALLSIALAVLLALLAIDVSRWNDAFAAGDVRYRSTPADERLWQPSELAPADLGRRALAVQDDVEFRQAVRALRTADLEDAVISDPEVAIRRNEAQARLEAVVVRDSDNARRSRAAGLLGVLGLARFVYETQEREALLSATIANLTLAIALDPDERRGEVQPRARLPARTWSRAERGIGGIQRRPRRTGVEGRGRRPARQRLLA